MANAQAYYSLIERPLLTEKSTTLQGLRNQYTFRVHPNANKTEIKKAIETLFEVKVEKVNIIKLPGKMRRFMGRPGHTGPWKKALVKIQEGQTIELV